MSSCRLTAVQCCSEYALFPCSLGHECVSGDEMEDETRCCRCMAVKAMLPDMFDHQWQWAYFEVVPIALSQQIVSLGKMVNNDRLPISVTNVDDGVSDDSDAQLFVSHLSDLSVVREC